MKRFNYTKVEPANPSFTMIATHDYFDIGKLNCRIEVFVHRCNDGTFYGTYHIMGDFGWHGGVGSKVITVTNKATPEEAFEKVVAKAERWIAKYLDNYGMVA